MTMTTSERVKAIRAALKAEGWNARKASVRKSTYSMGATISVTVRDLQVPLAEVRAIAEGIGQEVRRCAYSGDVLKGGNTYVDVEYSEAALEPLADMVLAGLEGADLEKDAEVWGFRVRLDDAGDFEVWKDGDGGFGERVMAVWAGAGLPALAKRLAERLASTGALTGVE